MNQSKALESELSQKEKKQLQPNIVTVTRQRTNLQRIERALLTVKEVEDCYVMVRDRELVAYVVQNGSWNEEFVRDRLTSQLPECPLPSIYVPISALPLTNFGEVDEVALGSITVIDSELIKSWEERIGSNSEIEQVAVVVRPNIKTIPPIHLKELLPSSQVVGDRVSTSFEVPISVRSENNSSTLERNLPAISHGEALVFPESTPQTLGEMLQQTASKFPNRGIIYINSDGCEEVQSYSQLLESAQKILGGLKKLGLKPQDKVILQLNKNRDFIEAFWACILGGFVPVPISIASIYEPSNNSAKKLQNAWQMLEKPMVLTSNNLAPQIDNLFSQLHLQEFTVTSIEDLRFCDNDGDQSFYQARAEDLALLLLTSGSTGMPKGVQLSHSNIICSIVGTAEIGNFTSQDISLNWLPLDHPGPLIRCVIRMVYLGCQQIHAPTTSVLQNPLKWLDWIERYKVTNTWSPNFAFALLNNCDREIKKRHWDLSSIKSWLNTAEPIIPQTAQKILELLKPYGLTDTAMQSSWGMAETASGITHSQSYLEKSTVAFAELGKPIPGISLRIVNERDRIVSEKTIGYLQVKGATVTSGYYRAPEINQQAFIEDGWFKTGDLGYLEEGRLVITGRSKDVIIINGNNCYSHEIEAVVEEIEGVEVSYTAACGIRKTGADTDSVAIFFHTSVRDDDRLKKLLKQIQKNVAGKIGVVPSYLIPVEKQVIPKTSIGKIQRAQLVNRFTEGQFDDIVKNIDILFGNDRTLPNWFYRLKWRAKEAVTLESNLKEGLTLVFLDSLGLGEYLCGELNKSDRATIAVEIGANFSQLAPDRYCIDPTNPQDYQRLLESVSKDNQSLEQILHLWTYDNYNGEIESLEALKRSQSQGIYSLLLLVRALDKVRENKIPVKLQVIASHSQATNESEDLAYERSPLIGMLKTIPQEMTWLDCRHLDLLLEAPQINADRVLRELKVIQKDEEVAYRQGQRLIARLERVELRSSDRRSPLKQGGIYLISGGLGGIGVEIAKYLLQEYQARLLLVGRTPLPPRNTWSAHLEEGGKLGDRIQAYLSLEELNAGEIAYSALDLTDLEGLQQLVREYNQQWNCQLDGVIHLAGTIQTSPILEETFQKVTATFAPKLEGTWVLYQLIKNQPNSLFVSFSSVNGFFGRMTAGSYSAANRFLDSFTQHLVSNSSVRAYCFAWSMWEETGLSRNYQMKELNRSRGYHIIQPKQGLNSFIVGLNQDKGYLLVGLDESKQYIRQYTETELAQTQQLRAYFTANNTNCLNLDRFQALEIRDRFGSLSSCQLQQVEQIPLTETGEIDNESEERSIAPRNEVEQKLTKIWEKILNIKPIGIRDNFFTLGGHSLLALRLFAEIEDKFGKKLPLTILFQAPTIEDLAINLQQEESSQSWSALVPIKPQGSKPPLFLMHAKGASVLIYRELANYLDDEQPVYGLQPYGLDGQHEHLTVVEDMAANYIREIQTIQPLGPYLLGGYSFGGKLALEVAHQLRDRGETVSLLALFDCHAKQYYQRESLHKRLFIHLDNLVKQKHKYLIYKLQDWKRWLEDNFKFNVQKLALQLFQILDISLPLILRTTLIEEINMQASENYQLKYYPGKITLLRAKEWFGGVGVDLDDRLGWGDLVEDLEIHDISGHHLSIFKQPHVPKLAKILQSCLDRTQKQLHDLAVRR
jgi:acyl-CoA synthetase (AMP-forming)/AMP-acid ligase II/thioesterase domain-containing protein/NAD(P)-dependent dehydrogenase (short-subunit alcohol dehydrogenase family)/acyl carrier protein